MDPYYTEYPDYTPSRRDLEAAIPYRSTQNARDENRTLRQNIKELKRRQGELLQHIARLEGELASKNLKLSRYVSVPYGSYSSSGANPKLLHDFSEKVFMDLVSFVLFSIHSGTPTIESANSLKARVSEVFFSKFEHIDFGVKGESLFTIPGLLPEQSLTEFRAFLAYADHREEEAVKPYIEKYSRYLAFKGAKIQKTCGQDLKFNEASDAYFCSLAMNVWMLHKLTLSFERANVKLMRVVRGEPFIDKFMEPVGQKDEYELKEKPPATTTTVKHMIVPGLWVNNSVIKCRVCLGSTTGQELSTAPATQLREGGAVNGTGPRSAGVTQDKAHQPTRSQVPDREAPAAHAYAYVHQQTQATDEPHVFGAPDSPLPDEELGNDKTPAVEVNQAAQEMTNVDITKSPIEELEEKPPLQPPYPTTMMENYYSPSPNSAHFAHHGNRPNSNHGSAHQSKPRGF